MSKISDKPNHFLTDPWELNQVELQKYLGCCLDPLPGLPDSSQDELTMLPLQKAVSYRPAAVLVPLLRVQSDWHILMTKRAAHLAHHAGQISFPGGKLESYDASPVEAALREAFEEVQLTPGLVQVVGLLDRVLSPAGFIVQPVVGIVRGENAFDSLVSNPAEVDLILTPDRRCFTDRHYGPLRRAPWETDSFCFGNMKLFPPRLDDKGKKLICIYV